jgi:hypothetical protein
MRPQATCSREALNPSRNVLLLTEPRRVRDTDLRALDDRATVTSRIEDNRTLEVRVRADWRRLHKEKQATRRRR